MIPTLLDVAHWPIGRLPERIVIPPLPGWFHATITPPGSKSLTNRALLLAALASGRSRLDRPLVDADDAQRMLAALETLGARHQRDGESLLIDGVAGRWPARPEEPRLDLGNAGTATRFLAAAAVLGAPGSPGVVIDGNARMRERPIAELADPLRRLGARVEFLGREGYPPMRVSAGEPVEGATITFGKTASSQFVSAVLLVAPFMHGGVTVRFDDPGTVTSRAYVEMTVGLLRRVGATVLGDIEHGLHVFGTFGRTGLRGFELAIEPDASGATYFLAAAALLPGSACTIPGLGAASLQGDAAFARELVAMGAAASEDPEHGITVRGPSTLRATQTDLRSMPDAAMTLAVACCFATGASRMNGLSTLRVKETDRLAALVTELSKLGAKVRVERSGSDEALVIEPAGQEAVPGRVGDPVEFATYDDHRMAMALALVGLRGIGRPVVIRDPACVAKTYPTYWRDLAGLYPPRSVPG